MPPPEVVAPTREETLAVVRRCLRAERLVTEDGRTLTNYVDGHALLGDPVGLAGCCELVWERVAGLRPAAAVGEVTAACPLVSGVILAARRHGIDLRGCYVRKAEKGYGVPGLLTTELPPGSRVVLLDDVTGVGAGMARTVDAVRSAGHEVLAAVVVLDRGEGARERLAAEGVELSWLFGLQEAEAAPTGPGNGAVGVVA